MTERELDHLEKQTNLLLRKLNQVLAEAPDEPDDDDVAAGDQGQDRWDDMAEEANPDEAEPDDDEDDQEDFSKSEVALQQENNANTRPGARASSAHYSPGLTATPATRPERHKFDALCEHVANRDKVTPSEAMSRARLEYPDVYQAYQRFAAASPTLGKSAPPSLIDEQIAKGCTPEIAAVRCINARGNAAMADSHFAKRAGADDEADTFIDKAEELWLDSDLSRCESLRATRKNFQNLYKRLV